MKTTKLFMVLGLSVMAFVAFAFANPTFAAPLASNPAQDTAAAVNVSALTAQEIASLQYMREEEKLAHDVYVTLYAKWQLPIFNNISYSEARHTSAIKNLLDRYGIADPAAGKAVGEFTNPDLQKMYNDLVAQGSQSSANAIQVGVTIEQTDIRDLQSQLQNIKQWDIQRVYNNLLRGSQNHLRAFQRFQ